MTCPRRRTPSSAAARGTCTAFWQCCCKKNPQVRIVATAVSLESVAELTACMKEFPFADTEVVSVQIARSRKAGAYQLMTGQNPVYVFTMQAGGGV